MKRRTATPIPPQTRRTTMPQQFASRSPRQTVIATPPRTPNIEAPRAPSRRARSRHWPAGLIISASLGALLLCAAAPSGTKLQTVTRTGGDPTELSLFPTGAWIRPLTCGFNELVADVVWLRALQYYGEHRASDQRYPYLETLFQTLTDLDPRFVNAYIFGALTLAEDEGQLDRGLALLQRGMAANPESWWLVFEYGFLQYIHGNDPTRAGHWLARAARMEGSPEWVQRLAAHASAKAGDRETALALWLEVYHNSDNDEIRRIAREYLERLGHLDFAPPAEGSSGASDPARDSDVASDRAEGRSDASRMPTSGSTSPQPSARS